MQDCKCKEAQVTLISSTPSPLRVIAAAIDIWHHQDFAERQYTEHELEDKFRWLLKQPHQTPLEFVSLVWIFKNVSRAFQQQLTRHRIGFSYSIQSLRVVNVGSFAAEGRYTLPSTVKNKNYFHVMMLDIQNSYLRLTEGDRFAPLSKFLLPESVEDARGILPLNIHSPIMMCCTYRSLVGMLRQRLCVSAQEEWSLVANSMRKEIEKIHPVMAEPLDCMCGRLKNGRGFCKTLHKEV